MRIRELAGAIAKSAESAYRYVTNANAKVESAQKMVELLNESKRHQERMKEYEAWVKPENIQKRLEEYLTSAQAAIDAGLKLKEQIRKDLNLPLEDPPLPEPLPDEYKGQSESTIRAMLRQKEMEYDKVIKIWKKKI